MLNIMIYTPSLDGHRQVACGVIADLYLSMNHNIYLLVPFKSEEELVKWRHIGQFASNPKVKFLSANIRSRKKDGYLSAEEIGIFQKQYKIDLTLFEEGDFFVRQFIRLSEDNSINRYGKNVAIFTRTSPWFPGENAYTGELVHNNVLIMGAKAAKNFLLANRTYFIQRKNTSSYFFPKVVMKKNVVSTALMADERIPEKYGHPFIWMPTIYKSFTIKESSSDISEYDRVKKLYDSFLKDNMNKDILLYFGISSEYKGYEKILKLALNDNDSCFVHCGRITEDVLRNEYITRIRDTLSRSKRIFETKAYIQSQKLVEYFFNSAKYIVSTHNYLGPSGTMVQAIELGKPILTPDKGLIGYRTSKYKLGMTYRHNDLNDLIDKWYLLKNIPVEQFKSNLLKYHKYFSREKLDHIYSSIL